MARSNIVKVNITLGTALLIALRKDAEDQDRGLSRQLSHYVSASLAHPPLTTAPSETLDDNDGRMTAYFDESVYNRLLSLKVKTGTNLSAVVRACLIHARYLLGVSQ